MLNSGKGLDSYIAKLKAKCIKYHKGCEYSEKFTQCHPNCEDYEKRQDESDE